MLRVTLCLRRWLHCQMMINHSHWVLSCLAEWADREAFKKHITSEYVKHFAEYITEVSSACCAHRLAVLCGSVPATHRPASVLCAWFVTSMDICPPLDDGWLRVSCVLAGSAT